jgi:hypothetical protein
MHVVVKKKNREKIGEYLESHSASVIDHNFILQHPTRKQVLKGGKGARGGKDSVLFIIAMQYLHRVTFGISQLALSP